MLFVNNSECIVKNKNTVVLGEGCLKFCPK